MSDSNASGSKRAPAGELTRRVMEVLWACEQCTVRDVHERLAAERPIAYTTVMTVMNRLAEQGVLQREIRRKTGYFSAATSRDEAAAGELVDELVGRYGALGLAKLVERSRDSQMLEQLEALIRQQRRVADEDPAGA